MPKRAKELTALQVRRLVGKPGLHPVGGIAGLGLKVTPPSAVSWILRTMAAGRRRDIGLGPYPEISLEFARESARKIKADIRAGNDPVRDRQTAKLEREAASHTFKHCCELFLEKKLPELRSDKGRDDYRGEIERYVYPIIGNVPVADITIHDVLKVLEPHWHTKTETMKRLRQRIEAVLSLAAVKGWRSDSNPARWSGNLDVVLPKPSKIAKVQHLASMPYQQIPEFMQALRAKSGVSAQALEFLILTAARTGEVRGAQWHEIDIDKAVWTIPAERMKAAKDHVIPLTERAITLLKSLDRVESGYVFTARQGRQIGQQTMKEMMQRMGYQFTVHGFRSTFSTWSQETTEHSVEAVELSLAHVATDATRAAYARGMLLDKRRELLADWSDFLDGADVLGFPMSEAS